MDINNATKQNKRYGTEEDYGKELSFVRIFINL